MTPRAERVRRLLNPSSVVFVGGGGLATAIDYCRANGYSGGMRAVNPRRDDIAGVRCVPSIADLDTIPDLAFIAVPKEVVVEVVAALSDWGVAAAVCNSSGFSESTDGADRQQALIEAAGSMPVMGPNCPGFANYLDGAVFMMDHFGDHAPDEGVAVISNGGAYISDIGCADRSLPIGYMVGLGNQAMVTVADMLDAVLDDRRVTAINLYFEGITDIAALSQAAAKAARLGKPVVVIKGGRSEAGSRAAQSHTASLSGTSEVASALFRRFGWVEVTTPSEAIETLKMLTLTPIPKGCRTGFVTSSGSYAVLGGDAAEREGLEMRAPSDAAATTLCDALPDYVGPANPLDISDAHGWSVDRIAPIYNAFFADPHDIALQVMCYPPPGGWDSATWDNTVSALAAAKGDRAAAFVNTLQENLPTSARTRMIKDGIAPLQGLTDGMRAVGNAARYGAIRETFSAEAMLLPEPRPIEAERRTVDEADAKARLAAYGLPIPEGTTIGEGCVPSEDYSFPVVLKVIVGGLLHKTDVGGVTLGIQDAMALGQEVKAMRTRLKAAGHQPSGYLVESMVKDPVGELLVGVRRIPDIGLTLTLSIGGVAVELMDDTTTVILPAERSTVDEALRKLRLFPLINGYRGKPAANLTAAVDVIMGLARFAANNPNLIELEINPLILSGTGAWIADAVLIECGD